MAFPLTRRACINCLLVRSVGVGDEKDGEEGAGVKEGRKEGVCLTS